MNFKKLQAMQAKLFAKEQHDDFLLSNFKLIGESYRKEYYTDQVIQFFDKRY